MLEVILLAVSGIGIYGWYFKIRWKMLVMGIPAIIGAYYIELYFLNLSFIDMFILLVVVAPIVEELLKFLCTIFGKDIKTAMSVGLMFATVENILYYMAFSGIFFFIFSLREFTDPLLHMTTTSFSVKAWKRRFYGIIIAISMHSFWNYYSIQIANFPYLIFILALVYGSILVINIRIEKTKIKNIKPLYEVN